MTKILCLHGYHGNSQILRQQIAPLAAGLPASVELVYVDAPSLSSGSLSSGSRSSRSSSDFGWWHEGFRGWERTREWAVGLLNAQHFDGILGFSQGAALAGLLAALRDSGPAPISFDFAIMVGGFTSNMSQHAALFGHKLTVPSVHVTGRADTIVPIRDSLLLADRFADPVVIEHPGGHVIPGDPAITRRIADFVTSRAQLTTAAGAPDA
jgi:fermentation-respiration switch protein FrsA (DUF1100 family)